MGQKTLKIMCNGHYIFWYIQTYCEMKPTKKPHQNGSTINGVIVLWKSIFSPVLKIQSTEINHAPSLWRHYAKPIFLSIWQTMKIPRRTIAILSFIWGLHLLILTKMKKPSSVFSYQSSLNQKPNLKRNFQFKRTHGHNEYSV